MTDHDDLHQRLRSFWDEDARTYDLSASHSISDPVEAAAWRAVLLRHLPPPPAAVLDVGAGTGAMSLLAAELGYRVTALDLSAGMLARAEAKAGERGLPLEIRVGPATEPPAGPFDAVIERHLLWTAPDPVAALRAWRGAAPGGRLVSFEGIWSRGGRADRVRDAATRATRRMMGVRHDHHGEYDPHLLRSLPLAGVPSPQPLLRAVAEAGWRAVRVERLRDVEWARRLQSPFPLGTLERRPQFAVIADG